MKTLLWIVVAVAGVLIVYAVVQAVRISMLARAGKELADATVRFERTPEQTSGGEPYRVLVLGDSSAVGVGASGPELSVAGRLAALSPRISIENAAVSGARVHDLTTLALPTPSQPYDLVVIHIGGNDVTHVTKLADMRRDFETTLERVAPLGKQVIALTGGEWRYTPFFPWPTSYFFAHRADQVYALFSEIAAGRGVTYVDILSYVRARNLMRGADYFAVDGFHPSDKSYEVWFAALVGAAQKDAVAIPGLPTLP